MSAHRATLTRVTQIAHGGNSVAQSPSASAVIPAHQSTSAPTAAVARDASTRSRPYHAHVHRLRGIAILGVVSMHVVDALGGFPPGLGQWVLRLLLGDGSPIFLVISGFLFRETLRTYRYRSLLRRKVRNLLIPYLVISTPALVIYVAGLKSSHAWLAPEFFEQHPALQVLVLLGTGAHLGPLWFVPMISLFFLASPAFALLERWPRLYLALPALLALTLLVPRPEGNSNPVQAFVHFCSLFVLGMFLARHHASITSFCGRHCLGVVVLGACAIALLVLVTQLVPSAGIIQRAGVGIYLMFLLYFWRDLGHVGGLLDRLGAASFPIFFIHGYPVAVLRDVADGLALDPLLWFLAWGALTLGIAGATAALAFGARSVLGRRSRYVVGF